ncbi:hypothetical protein D7Z54_27400 [Salibacterium salarium]|uniref:Spore coat protein CotO n=1 Tax=Salibacterium salarium TaxID=284579 RepID=A0A428MVQ1_9BACI|nr:hypothetical protein [Salibacterium salarium]RSL30218.1 hypothetical protein D7Z54_27400 [Salibacterium salarium]
MVMEQEQQQNQNQNQQAQPLYYIEQPDLSPLSDQGQSVSVRKKIGEESRKKSSSRKERNARSKKRNSESKNLEMTDVDNKEAIIEDQGEEVEEEVISDDEESFKEISSNRTVKEMLEYIESLPHYIQPIIACETKDKYIQGTLLQSDNGEIKIKDRRNLASKVIKESEITEMYIVSL